MTRRSFFARLSGAVAVGATQTPQKQKYYVTGGRLTTDGTPRDDCKVPALICEGHSRLDALTSSGITVWTAQEYYEGRDGVQARCGQKR